MLVGHCATSRRFVISSSGGGGRARHCSQLCPRHVNHCHYFVTLPPPTVTGMSITVIIIILTEKQSMADLTYTIIKA